MELNQIKQIESIIGYKFRNTIVLERAFIHASFAHQNNLRSYDRLEFFGDSIIGFIITEKICKKFTDAPQGDLTSLKKTLVSTIPLSKKLRGLGLDKFIQVTKATKISDKICEDVFEAIVAAIYLDSNLETAKEFLLKQYDESEFNLVDIIDYKSKVLEMFGANSVQFKTIKKSGPDHKPVFTISLIINGKAVASAKAEKKLSAEQKCSKMFLSSIIVE